MKHYPASIASKATNTPMLKLQRLLERGQIKLLPCDLPSRGSGEPRGYSFRRLVQIAITTELTWLGIAPSRAAHAAFKFTDCASPGREVGELFSTGRTILVGLNKQSNEVFNIPPDGTLDDCLRSTNAAFVIDCGKIIRKVKEQMSNI